MNVNIKIQEKRHVLEVVKWIIVIILLVIAIVGNYLYRKVILSIRMLITVMLIILAGCIVFLSTKKGKSVTIFYREAITEVRKVVWPTRQEALQTTLIIIAVTAIMSLILWGLDGILIRLVSFITSLRF